MVLRKFSGCVPPMDDTNTTWDTPAALAASICFFAPSQSTSSGVPPGGKENSGRPTSGRRSSFLTMSLTSDRFLIAGTAEVHSTTASQPAMASASAASSATSAATTSSPAAPAALRALAALADRARPRGATSA